MGFAMPVTQTAENALLHPPLVALAIQAMPCFLTQHAHSSASLDSSKLIESVRRVLRPLIALSASSLPPIALSVSLPICSLTSLALSLVQSASTEPMDSAYPVTPKATVWTAAMRLQIVSHVCPATSTPQTEGAVMNVQKVTTKIPLISANNVILQLIAVHALVVVTAV